MSKKSFKALLGCNNTIIKVGDLKNLQIVIPQKRSIVIPGIIPRGKVLDYNTPIPENIASSHIKGHANSRGILPYIGSESNIRNKDFLDDVDVKNGEGFASRGAEGREKMGEINRGIAGGMGASKAERPYSHIPDSPSVGPGKKFTKTQKDKLIEENMKKNDGIVRSDKSGIELTRPQKSQKGVKPDPNEWQIDHIDSKSKGGSNSYNNAQVLSRKENREKWDK
ncbi:HNH endonuclease [Anaerospora hongkongensis]|uniref:HNH endonuclease n=1 Tax=Anaerospora hongkongensis TaxID=244830 RepID=UPI00289D4E20|nr:hypothetical protein [Anaerospora hongkongensis]